MQIGYVTFLSRLFRFLQDLIGYAVHVQGDDDLSEFPYEVSAARLKQFPRILAARYYNDVGLDPDAMSMKGVTTVGQLATAAWAAIPDANKDSSEAPSA